MKEKRLKTMTNIQTDENTPQAIGPPRANWQVSGYRNCQDGEKILNIN